MSVPTCAHLTADGLVCNSPALRGKRFCHFYLDPSARRLKTALARTFCALRLAKARRLSRAKRSPKTKLASSSQSPISPIE